MNELEEAANETRLIKVTLTKRDLRKKGRNYTKRICNKMKKYNKPEFSFKRRLRKARKEIIVW